MSFNCLYIFVGRVTNSMLLKLTSTELTDQSKVVLTFQLKATCNILCGRQVLKTVMQDHLACSEAFYVQTFGIY